MDQAPVMAFVEYATVGVECPEHGVVVTAVPWAEHASASRASSSNRSPGSHAVLQDRHTAELMRIDRASVGGICRRVYDELDAGRGPLRRPGPHRHRRDFVQEGPQVRALTVVLDHDANRVVWREGHGKAVLKPFFEQLSEDQRDQHTGGDGRRRALDSGARESYCPNAERVMDPFHVVSWMTDVVDELRKQAWRRARAAEARRARGRRAKAVKGSRYALLQEPEDSHRGPGRESLERVARRTSPCTGPTCSGACATCSRTGSGAEAGSGWSRLASACRTRIDEVKELSKKVRRHKDAIVRAVELGISNARVEAINNKIKLTVRMAYGFRNFDNLVALVMLRCSNLPIALPGR